MVTLNSRSTISESRPSTESRQPTAAPRTFQLGTVRAGVPPRPSEGGITVEESSQESDTKRPDLEQAGGQVAMDHFYGEDAVEDPHETWNPNETWARVPSDEVSWAGSKVSLARKARRG